MKNKKVLLWTARIWSAITLVFMIFMVGAHIVESISGESGDTGFDSTKELISFYMFPILSTVGLAIAWKWEGLGGLITILAMIVFHIIRPDLLFNPMIDGLMFPSILFLIYWFISRKQKNMSQ